MRARRVLATILVAGGLTAAGAVPALAHTELVSSGPAKGAVVKHLPKVIVLNFSEAVHSVDAGTVVLGGVNHAVSATLNPKNAAQIRIRTKTDTAGRYTVTVKLTADDGHKETIRYRFRVKR